MFTVADISTMVTAMAAAVASVASITWFMSTQFSKIRNLIYERIMLAERELLEKIEYHERHDDQRFSEIKNDLWTIKLAVSANTAAREKRLALLAAMKDRKIHEKLADENGN